MSFQIDCGFKGFHSAGSYHKAYSNVANQDVLYPIKFLNTLRFPGLPNHKLTLKVGLPIMLLRNLNQNRGFVME